MEDSRLNVEAEATPNTMERGVGASLEDPPTMRCCCGREDCVFLRHSCTILESVEKDVHQAAKMGQALLDRHEAYMASAEKDRSELTARIEELEMANSELEAANKRTTDENHMLQDQVERLDTEIKDSETQVTTLEAMLRETQMEVRRLETATARAAALERHIAVLEEEQISLQNTVTHTEEEARTAMYRWKKAERSVIDLQVQLEQMEREAREERDRHQEVLGRMEKQREVEKDLNAAAGRLKGAAAAKSLHDGKSGTVVSHFVRDLLQDNANLQIGIAELRELLMNSNDEIQMLREQLQDHQPISEGEASTASTLRAELEPREAVSHTVNQALHIHHHYHVEHHAEPRKPRRKRQGLVPGIFTPPFGASTPSTPSRLRLNRASPASIALRHRHTDSAASGVSAVSTNPRWSMVSENTSDFVPSSAPSSPMSSHRNSMFDRSAMDLHSPTSPMSPTTSIDPLSPSWGALRHRKKQSEMSGASISTMAGLPPAVARGRPAESMRPSSSQMAMDQHRATTLSPTPAEEVPELTTSVTGTDDSTDGLASTEEEETNSMQSALSPALSPVYGHFDSREQRPSLHRIMSHESIISLTGGLDIHTLKARPSQLTLRQLGATSASTNLSTITAEPTLAKGRLEKRSSLVLKDNLLGLGVPMPRMRDRVVSGPGGTRTSQPALAPRQSMGALGRVVSWRPWTNGSQTSPQPIQEASFATTTTTSTAPVIIGSPASASSALQGSLSATSTPALGSSLSSSHTTTSTKTPNMAVSALRIKDRDLLRAPGINQPGSIPGFYEYWASHQRRTPSSKVLPDSVDQDALRDGLGEG